MSAHSGEKARRTGDFRCEKCHQVTHVAHGQSSSTAPAMFDRVEGNVQQAVEWLRLGVEALGAVVIGAGILMALVAIARHLFSRNQDDFIAIRLEFARYLTLALELQLAADILSTSVAPTWDRIGKLAAIAVIRTALNFFLSREMKEEQHMVAEHTEEAVAGGAKRAPAGAEGSRS
jgi:uncharacterized membrane protein